MFTDQSLQGFNSPILRPLWLMTSTAADVISVPCVKLVTARQQQHNQTACIIHGVYFTSVSQPLYGDVIMSTMAS